MGFNFERNLEHQEIAITAIKDVFKDIKVAKVSNLMCNHFFNKDIKAIQNNIEEIQIKNGLDVKSSIDGSPLVLDIKMETGTGKTYTYTKTMFKLNEEYGINKFVIVVPTLPIKLGTEAFLMSHDTKQHFRELFGVDYEVEVVNSKKTKNKKETFPLEVSNFVKSTAVDKKIHILLINSGMLNSKTMIKVFDDASLFGDISSPLQLISKVNPFVIMDEPHKFKRSLQTYKNLLKMEPQCLIRFGATFPEEETGKDYENLLYNLTSAQAFNKDLVKGVTVQIPKFETKRDVKVTITSIQDKNVIFKVEDGKKTISRSLTENQSLNILHSDFSSLKIDKVKAGLVILSNGLELRPRQSLHPSSFSNTYQEAMIEKAIHEHFKKELELFQLPTKIKPLTLFFIDDISAYRDIDNNEPYIKNIFEHKLKEKICMLIQNTEVCKEYKEYLQATLNNLEESHAGYFSKDNSTSDEKIEKEINEILKGKEALTKYKVDGNWNIRRFIFSKWTLKEGWDNPNIFTICKLRSSGSEISKLQEVGRGLRLPVNEAMFRVPNLEHDLSYIVDFTEKDFAKKLIDEINSDSEATFPEVITDAILERLASEYNMTTKEIFMELIKEDLIDMNRKVIKGNISLFINKYPVITTGVKNGKVNDESDSSNSKRKVKIRQSRYSEFKELWEKINTKVSINYKVSEEDIVSILVNCIEDVKIGNKEQIGFMEQKIEKNVNELKLLSGKTQFLDLETKLTYIDFIKLLSKNLSLSLATVNNSFVEYAKTNEISNALFNKKTASEMIQNFKDKINTIFINKIEYQLVDTNIHPTALTNADGTLKKVAAYRLGDKEANEEVPKNYLYEEIFYDSNEIDIIKEDIDNIIVFGKIPQGSIKIPVINGETYSPDFAYVIKSKDGSKKLNLVVESKNKNKTNFMYDEDMKIALANSYFEKINLSGIKVEFELLKKGENVTSIINRILNALND